MSIYQRHKPLLDLCFYFLEEKQKAREAKAKEEAERKKKEEQERIQKEMEELFMREEVERKAKEQSRKDMEEQIAMSALGETMKKQIKFDEHVKVGYF